MSSPSKNLLRIVVIKDGDVFVAQCLEHDISAQATDLTKLKHRISAALTLEREYSLRNDKEPFCGIGPAPQHFHDLWDRRSDFVSHIDDEHPLELAMCA